jgi:hypothetical protein
LEVFFREAYQGPSQSHADGTCLADGSASGDANKDVDFVGVSDVFEGLDDETSFHIGDEVFFESTVVDGNFSGPWSHANAGDGRFATSGTEAITVDFVFLCEHAGFSLKANAL